MLRSCRLISLQLCSLPKAAKVAGEIISSATRTPGDLECSLSSQDLNSALWGGAVFCCILYGALEQLSELPTQNTLNLIQIEREKRLGATQGKSTLLIFCRVEGAHLMGG